MRVLILSVTAGYGHLSAAQAIAEELDSRNVTTRVLDLYEETNTLLFNVIDKGYSFSIRHVPTGFGVFYRVLETRNKKEQGGGFNPIGVMNKLSSVRFVRFIKDFSPDCIVCTHPLAAMVVSSLKIRGKIRVPAIGIVTDYTILPYWEDCTAVEYIVIAHELLSYRATKRGIAPERLLPVGIPIKAKFSRSITKEEARMQSGIPLGPPAVLVMSGSMGHGDLLTMTNDLMAIPIPLEIIVVCGRNEEVYRTLVERNGGLPNNGRLHVIGFTDQVDVLMNAVDCIITKPGGLSISESLVKELPMILITPIPGQEERNIDFLMNMGAALRASKTFSVTEAVHYLFECPGRLRLMQESIALIRKPNAAKDLADFILGL